MSNECKKSEKCSAPLCPLEESTGQVWFSDEPICTLESCASDPMVMNQVAIKKQKCSSDGCFTRRMLRNLSSITPSLEGLDPDTVTKRSETAWIKSHKQS